MVPVKSVSRLLSPSFAKKRFLLILRFYCDESYFSDPNQDADGPLLDAYAPRTFVVGGFLAQDKIWERVERRWDACNKRFGVNAYHATHVNGFRGEFENWKKGNENDKAKQFKYSKKLLEILADQGKGLCAISSGLKSKDYVKIINADGRTKWGSPYIVCFKQCVSLIAQLMGNLPLEYRFSVVLDRNSWQDEAINSFYGMKDCIRWPDHDRLVMCAPGNQREVLPIQTADLMAYETFKLFDTIHSAKRIRPALRLLLPFNNLVNHSWDSTRLKNTKSIVENATVGPNGFIALLHGNDLKKEMFKLG